MEEKVTQAAASTQRKSPEETQDKAAGLADRQAQMPTWNRSAEGHKHHSGDRVFETNGAAEMRGQVPGHSCQNANERNGDKEAGPAIPVLSWRDESKEDLPENCQEVHNVIKAGRQAFLPALLLIVVT